MSDSFTVKELLQEIRGDVKGIDKKLDDHLTESAMHITRLKALEDNFQAHKDNAKWVVGTLIAALAVVASVVVLTV